MTASDRREEHRKVRSGSRPRPPRTLDKGLDLLEQIVSTPMSLSELGQSFGMSRTTLRRFSQVLIVKRLVSLEASGTLRAGPRLLQWASAVDHQTDLLKIARRHLQELASITGHTAFLGRRDGAHSVHLLRCEGREAATVVAGPGTRRLLAETSLGRALLLDENGHNLKEALQLAFADHPTQDVEAAICASAEAGYVLSHGTAPDFIHGVASPIRDASGRIVAAISIASARTYLNAERMALLGPTLHQTAAKISYQLGYVRSGPVPGNEAGSASLAAMAVE
ncbi:IclR family transcriptional regulator [Sphingomonas sp. BIUV-7]|uniref:IclR family transcriptional regulator n=1 Tax=Sphingomonas natans TaxID=3063330 RepID=A0ABT8YAG6_9SPHN|nr:IclR family transcriptional regulator [Sphingomonas sp. BIUV-7]MDO6414704.1 IclR family transcriptional regulator [Sphingomonas sp. BIUV-7]